MLDLLHHAAGEAVRTGARWVAIRTVGRGRSAVMAWGRPAGCPAPRSWPGSRGGAVRWFATPNPALSGETPLSLLDTDAGVRQVDDVLTRIEFGVYG